MIDYKEIKNIAKNFIIHDVNHKTIDAFETHYKFIKLNKKKKMMFEKELKELEILIKTLNEKIENNIDFDNNDIRNINKYFINKKEIFLENKSNLVLKLEGIYKELKRKYVNIDKNIKNNPLFFKNKIAAEEYYIYYITGPFIETTTAEEDFQTISFKEKIENMLKTLIDLTNNEEKLYYTGKTEYSYEFKMFKRTFDEEKTIHMTSIHENFKFDEKFSKFVFDNLEGLKNIFYNFSILKTIYNNVDNMDILLTKNNFKVLNEEINNKIKELGFDEFYKELDFSLKNIEFNLMKLKDAVVKEKKTKEEIGKIINKIDENNKKIIKIFQLAGLKVLNELSKSYCTMKEIIEKYLKIDKSIINKENIDLQFN